MQIDTPKERNLFFSAQFDQKTIMELSKSIVDINDNDDLLAEQYKPYGIKIERKPIKIFIDSYGGAVYQCLGLVGIIENSKTPVHTICTGAAMSCGFILLLAGHKRFAYPHATMMYHQISSGANMKIQDIVEDLKECERLQKWLEDLTVRKTKLKRKALVKNRACKVDWYFTSKQALEYKIIEEILK